MRENSKIGSDSIIGSNAYIDHDVSIGNSCKIQNDAQIYFPAKLEDGVFIGPGVILTNDRFPRAVTPEGAPKKGTDWDPVGVTVKYGASIGAGAVCVAPLTIGAWAMVGAGSLVTSDVLPFALVVGAPARQVGWVGRSGYRLTPTDSGGLVCPQTGDYYEVSEGLLVPVGGRK